MIANAQSKIQIVDTHELLGTLVNIDVPVGMAQFNRTLVKPVSKK
jgi:ribose 5-phosphate isomerase